MGFDSFVIIVAVVAVQHGKGHIVVEGERT